MFAQTIRNLPKRLKSRISREPRQPRQVSPLALVLLLIFAAFCGLTIPFVGFVVPALAGVLALCVVVLALSPPAIVLLMFVLVLLVVGLLTFFLGIQQAVWIPYLLLLLIAVKYLIEKLKFSRETRQRLPLSAATLLTALFCLFFFMSAVANRTDVFSIGVAAKNYIFPWFFTLLVASTIYRTNDLRHIWKLFLIVAAVQLVFAIPQHFYFAKRGDASLDAVVGTFGGKFLVGGASGAMAIFLVFSIVLAASLYRQKRISGALLSGIVLAGFGTIALAEVKVFFLALPIGLVLLFRWQLLSNPGKTLGYSVPGALLLLLLVVAYQQTTSTRLSKADTLDGYFSHAVSAESDPYFFNPVTKELSRTGAILMWARYNSAANSNFYLGHGPAASRESQTLGSGVAARKYPFTLTTSTASTLLWDVGMAGYGTFLALLLVAGVTSFRVAKIAPPAERAALDAIGAMLLLEIPLSFYNRDLIDSAATQTLIAFWLGYILLCRKQFTRSSPEHHDALRKTR